MTVIEFAPRLEAARRRRSSVALLWPTTPAGVVAANFRLLLFPFLVAQLSLAEAARYLGTVSDPAG